MASCGICQKDLGFADKVHISETVLSTLVFSNPCLKLWPEINQKFVCELCAVDLGRKYAMSRGAKACRNCQKSTEACRFPLEKKFSGLWRVSSSSQSELEYQCVSCADSDQVSTRPRIEPWQSGDDDVSHVQNLDELAQDWGYDSWQSFSESNEKN